MKNDTVQSLFPHQCTFFTYPVDPKYGIKYEEKKEQKYGNPGPTGQDEMAFHLGGGIGSTFGR